MQSNSQVLSLTIAVALFVNPCVAQRKPASHCLTYEPSVVVLTGRLVRKTFPGPPGYESIRKGDRPENGWYLQLSSPICVDESKQDPDLNPARPDIRALQLVVPPEFYKKYRNLVGKQVTATGTLFGEHTGHHHTPVLLTVNSLARKP